MAAITVMCGLTLSASFLILCNNAQKYFVWGLQDKFKVVKGNIWGSKEQYVVPEVHILLVDVYQ